MILIIDGYNLLKQLFPKKKDLLDKQRKQLVKQLAFYKSKKNNIKEIILVFDGGLDKHATREISNGIVIIFSGQKNSADEWIENHIKKNKEKEFLLVTMDRELIKNCHKYGCDAIDGPDFYKILQETLLDKIEEKSKQSNNIKKYNINNENEQPLSQIDNIGLDLLMEQASMNIQEKDDNIYQNKTSRKSPAKKPSKKEKKILKKLRKL